MYVCMHVCFQEKSTASKGAWHLLHFGTKFYLQVCAKKNSRMAPVFFIFILLFVIRMANETFFISAYSCQLYSMYIITFKVW